MKYLARANPLLRPPVAKIASRAPSARTSVLAPPSLKRYYEYSKERFPLKQFLTLSAVISLLAALGTQAYIYGQHNDLFAVAMSIVAVFLLLLRLRLLDELKDLEHDRRFYPDRPLPRGLIRPKELTRVAVLVFLLEALVATSGGARSLGFFAVLALYSFLTLNEFFVRGWLRRHFTVYALSHEALVLPLCFYLYSLNGLGLADVTQPYFWLLTALIGGQFFLLEVTRKLRPVEFEVESQDTYTARYGIIPSCIMAGSLASGVAVLGILAATALGSSVAYVSYFGLAFLCPVGLSLLSFARRPNTDTAKATLNWSAGLVVATGALFTLAAWFVQ